MKEIENIIYGKRKIIFYPGKMFLNDQVELYMFDLYHQHIFQPTNVSAKDVAVHLEHVCCY
jgi:hypothetical protein